jgi:hypothetical protein
MNRPPNTPSALLHSTPHLSRGAAGVVDALERRTRSVLAVVERVGIARIRPSSARSIYRWIDPDRALAPDGITRTLPAMTTRREELIVAIRAVIGDRPTLFAALQTTDRFDDIERLLLAHPPSKRAVIADTDGIARLSAHRLTIEARYPQEIEVDPREVIVAEGARVEVGQPVTVGEVALADTIKYDGGQVAQERIARELRELLDIPAALADAVAAPMVSLIEAYGPTSVSYEIDVETPLGLMLSRERWEEAYDAAGDPPNVVGYRVVVGYDVLATHRDPPADVFAVRNAAFAARYAAETERVAQRARYVADLERRALDGDRLALQHLMVACLDRDATPHPALPDSPMRVCRDARPGTFALTRGHDGIWFLGCGNCDHRHVEVERTVAAVVAERPSLERFLALRPGTTVTFVADWLHVSHPKREVLPEVHSYWYRMTAHAREGALSLDEPTAAYVKSLVEAREEALAIGIVGERLLCPSWRAKELVIAMRPPRTMPVVGPELDRELIAIAGTEGLISAIKRCHETGMGLREAKEYVDALVARR